MLSTLRGAFFGWGGGEAVCCQEGEDNKCDCVSYSNCVHQKPTLVGLLQSGFFPVVILNCVNEGLFSSRYLMPYNSNT